MTRDEVRRGIASTRGRRTIVAGAALCALAAGGVIAEGGAAGAGTQTIKTHGTLTGHAITAPKNGSLRTGAAIQDSRSGQGALIGSLHVVGSKSTGTYVAFNRRGTSRGRTSITGTPGANGSISLAGKTTITGGTGALAGVHGTGTVNGTQDKDGYYVLHYSQTLTIPK